MPTNSSDAGRRIIAVGASCAALAVAFGAFGAHALEGRVSAEMLANYDTGARYHFLHALGMVAVGVLALFHGTRPGADTPGPGAHTEAVAARLVWAALLMLIGIVLFSGSLYTMALTGQRWLGAVTPAGGVAFIVAWALFAWAALDSGR
jgi:uncharacterized membrane protein YgdD (TMEM256/DUF423 family)